MSKHHIQKPAIASQPPSRPLPPAEPKQTQPEPPLEATDRPTQRQLCEDRGINTFFDRHDNALIGTAVRKANPDRAGMRVAVYDKNEIISNLLLNGMTEEEAQKHFDTFIAGSWHALATPIIIEGLAGFRFTD